MRPKGVRCLRTFSGSHDTTGLTPTCGTIPADLAGRLYRIGPGRFEDEAGPFAHWFDGEGLMTCIDFAEGKVATASRLIRPGETTKAQLSARGRFGRAPAGRWRCLRSLFDPDLYVNPANTALMFWQGRLFALYEGGLPTEIDPVTLDTIGETTLGVVKRGFGAHPKSYRPTGALINQGFRFPGRPYLDYFSLDATGVARTLTSVPFSGSLLNHDFAVTDRYIVSLCPPLFSDPFAIMAQQKPSSQALRWKPQVGTEVLVTPTDRLADTRRLKTDAFFYSHTANAFDDGNEIVIHGAVAADAGAMDWIASIRVGATSLASSTIGRMSEIRIKPKTGELQQRPLADCPFDYPVIDPRLTGRRHRFIYGVGFRDERCAYQDLFDCVLRLDTRDGTATKCDFGEGHFASEPIFVPRSADCGEGQGWLICVNYDSDADESYVAIIDSEAMTKIAMISFGRPLPMSFHGLWLDRSELTAGSLS